MAHDRRPREPRLVVHNTFLEYDDLRAEDQEESSRFGRRPRAQTDITETKLPRKVSYHMEDGQQVQALLGGASSQPGFGGLGSLSEVAPSDFPGFGLPPHDATGPMAAAAAAAAAAGLTSPFGPGGHMNVPYFGGFPPPHPGFPPWGHPQGFPPAPGVPGAWPYPPMPYPSGLDPAALGAAASHKPERGPAAPGALPPGAQRAGALHQTKGAGRGRGNAAKGGSGKDNHKGKGEAVATPDPPGSKAAGSESKTTLDPPVNGTTIMLRNLPNRYSQELLLELLDMQGFARKYDFVYLPMDFRNGVNLGYAFVNLCQHPDALKAIETFQGFENWPFESSKVCEVSWANPYQGLDDHVERYRNSPVMHHSTPEEYKPMVFKNGVRVPFPGPTKVIRPPKLKMNAQATNAAADAA